MALYVLRNNRINKRVWLDIAKDFRKGRTLPIDTGSFPVDGTRIVELQGLLGFMNALTQKGFQLGLEFELIEPSSTSPTKKSADTED